MGKFTRREFLEDTLFAAAAAAAGPAVPALAAETGPRAGPNDIMRVAVVGVKGRGSEHVSQYSGMKDAQVAAIVDIDEKVIGETMKKAEEKSGKKPEYFKDIRKMLDDKSIDAVSIATTNHTHSLYAIWAMQAGKHVYVEKPVSHNVWEGRQVVKCARKLNKICQTGTQSRSSPGLHEAVRFVRSGKLGKIKLARGLCYKRRAEIGKHPDEPVPAGVDYDIWLGPAPVRPFNRNRFHYNWHWFWDYGCGDLGNQGIHEMDRCRWFLGENELARRVLSLGGRVGYTKPDDGETANTQIVWLDFAAAPLIFEVRGLETDGLMFNAKADPKDNSARAKVGVIIYCEDGYVVNPSYSAATAFDKDLKKLETWSKGGDHFRNFTDSIRSGQQGELNADIEQGHLSSALCHLGNVSMRLGKPAPLGDANALPDDAAFQETLGRFKKHLEECNVTKDTPINVGRLLTLDPKAETFKGDDEANKMLTRDYRKPYVVPSEF